MLNGSPLGFVSRLIFSRIDHAAAGAFQVFPLGSAPVDHLLACHAHIRSDVANDLRRRHEVATGPHGLAGGLGYPLLAA